MFDYDKPSRIFPCILLTRNHMIFLVQFGINKHLLIFSKTTNCTRPTGSFQSQENHQKNPPLSGRWHVESSYLLRYYSVLAIGFATIEKALNMTQINLSLLKPKKINFAFDGGIFMPGKLEGLNTVTLL